MTSGVSLCAIHARSRLVSAVRPAAHHHRGGGGNAGTPAGEQRDDHLCVGYVVGPGGLNLIVPDPLPHADVIGRVSAVMTGAVWLARGVRAMVSWFGIRGIGTVFYLIFAIRHGVSEPLAKQLITLTLPMISASIFAHGMSIRPLMKWYGRR